MGCAGCGGRGGNKTSNSLRTYCEICSTRLMGRESSISRIGRKPVCPRCNDTYKKALVLEKAGRKDMIAARKKNMEKLE